MSAFVLKLIKLICSFLSYHPQKPLPEALVYVFAEAGQGEREAAVEALFDDAGVEQALAVRRHVARALVRGCGRFFGPAMQPALEWEG